MDSESEQYQQFLDDVQYSKNGLGRYEWIFGKEYLSTGGIETTKEIIPKLELKPGQKLLDMGSGLGGHDFYMVEKYDIFIDACDLSKNMMDIAKMHFASKPNIQGKIKFHLCDVTKSEFPENHYDAIYSRDALLHIKDKPSLFKLFFKWLKPGGRIVFTDYGRGEGELSQEFKDYVKQRDYTLYTRQEYEDMMNDCGYKNVQALDIRDKFVDALQMELNKLNNGKEDFLSKFSQKDFDELSIGWNAKIKRSSDGDQIWILGIGIKPTEAEAKVEVTMK